MSDEFQTPEEIVVKVWDMACAAVCKPSSEYQSIRTSTLERASGEIERAETRGRKQGIRMAVDNLKMNYCIVATEERIKEIEEKSNE